MEGTCKCGLECPVLVEQVFNFDIRIGSVKWTLGQTGIENIGKLCSHQRKTMAMAAFQQNRSPTTRHDSLTVKNVIMSPRVSSTVQDKNKEGIVPYHDGIDSFCTERPWRTV